MNDLISRQAAIDAVETKIKKWNAVDGEGYHVGLGLRYTDVIDTLTELPSAQPIQTASNYLQSLPTSPLLVGKMPSAQPETNCSEIPNNWIPCSERLPEDEYVLISKKPTKLSGSKWCVTIAIRMADPRSRKVNWRDIGFDVIQDNEVLAWMPLPEPYKGECKE